MGRSAQAHERPPPSLCCRARGLRPLLLHPFRMMPPPFLPCPLFLAPGLPGASPRASQQTKALVAPSAPKGALLFLPRIVLERGKTFGSAADAIIIRLSMCVGAGAAVWPLSPHGGFASRISYCPLLCKNERGPLCSSLESVAAAGASRAVWSAANVAGRLEATARATRARRLEAAGGATGVAAAAPMRAPTEAWARAAVGAL